MAAVLEEYFRLCFIRKPDTMDPAWAAALAPEVADALRRRYEALPTRARPPGKEFRRRRGTPITNWCSIR